MAGEFNNNPESDSGSEIIQNKNIASNLYNEKPDLSAAAIRHYAATRLSTLFDIPIMSSEKTVWQTINPIPALSEMNARNWNDYFLGFFAWAVDAMDFFCVSASASEIAASLGVNIKDITWGVTLVLMLRPVGAIIFGIATDYYGRKWPFIVNCLLFVVLEIGTGFAQTYAQFLGVRALFGVAMGGMYGNAAVTALENQPKHAKSVLSGFFLPGYNLGYLLSIVFYRGFQFSYKEGEGWRALFWFSAGLPVILIVWRFFIPESEVYLRMKAAKKASNARKRDLESSGEVQVVSKSWKDKIDPSIFVTIKTEWLMFIYLVLLMAGLNFISHASQDLYPTYLLKQRQFGVDERTVIMVVVNLGGMCGGIVIGQMSEVLGRRLMMIIGCIAGGCMLYPAYMMSSREAVTGGDFALVFFIMGIYGVIPIHLMELVNATHRTFLSGLVYQLGNLISSPSATIEADLGSNFPLDIPGVEDAYDYGLVMAIFCGAIFAYIIVLVLVGPERFNRDLSVTSDHLSIVESRVSEEEESKSLDKPEDEQVEYKK
ncbi:carboxylic acid transporter protein homolog [[Candida] anglica]|uniref:Carboxylic acid transporter protein homolog n=1 Tax=[Candida] anglica TaxID=148631 RepID=A0ABP0EGA2_9ASCO